MKIILCLCAITSLTSCAGMGGMAFGLTGTTKGVEWAVSAKLPEVKPSGKEAVSITP